MFKVQFIPQLGTARFEPTQGLRGVLLLMRRHREQCTPRGPGASGFGPRGLGQGLIYHGNVGKLRFRRDTLPFFSKCSNNKNMFLLRVFFGKWFPMVLASNKYGVLVNVLFDDDDDDGIELGPIIV